MLYSSLFRSTTLVFQRLYNFSEIVHFFSNLLFKLNVNTIFNFFGLECKFTMKNESQYDSTPERLLKAAGQLFAKKGYKKTTVREICDKADANLASINYYFRGKDKLFTAVIKYVVEQIWIQFPVDYNFKHAKTPEEKLFHFIRNNLLRRYSPEIPEWYNTLIRREIIGKTSEPAKLMFNKISSAREVCIGILEEIAEMKFDRETSEFCEGSVIGQVVHYIQSDYDSLLPFDVSNVTNGDIDRIARHITEFSLGGLEKIKKKEQQQ